MSYLSGDLCNQHIKHNLSGFYKKFTCLLCETNEQTRMTMISSAVLQISPAFCFKGVEFSLTALLHDLE